MNNYEKLTEKFLIDFDKLEVGQPLWSVIDDRVVIDKILKDSIMIDTVRYTEDGKLDFRDKYPTLFTSNPFGNLVEPLDSNCGEFAVIKNQPLESVEAEAEKYSSQYQKGLNKDIAYVSFIEGAEYAQKLPKEVEREIYTREDLYNAYRKGESKSTYYFKDTTVILPNNYQGVDG